MLTPPTPTQQQPPPPSPPPAFTIQPHPVENHRPLRVRVVGAGFSGIYVAIRIAQRLRGVDLVVWDKNEGVGGTWWENRYPGAACDIPSWSYQYSFEPNPDWSRVYAPAEEIRAYLAGVADKYGVNRFVKLQHKITDCTWDDDGKKWRIGGVRLVTGERFEDEADVLISARGGLNEIAWPTIEGFGTFGGEVMHSAKWNERYDFKNKKIGVIGGGSSAIQIVPQLQKIEGTHLSCFVRSRTWISNPFGDQAMLKIGLDPKDTTFSEEKRAELANDPAKYLAFRKLIETDGNTIHGGTFKNSDMQKWAVENFSIMMRERLAKKPEILESLLPSFAVGCRRLTPGPGYLEALVEDNVDFVSTPIKAITPSGVTLTNGRQIELDALVCATGFHAAGTHAPPFKVVGKGGTTLQARFTPFTETYLTMAVDGFPNFFMMLGPNSSIGTGSLTMMIEAEGDYIVKCIRKLQKEDYGSMAPRAARVADFTAYCGAYFADTVYMDECASWYRSRAGDETRVTGLWPGSTLHCLEVLRAPRWEDWEWEGREGEGKGGNRLGWLGNGWSVTQMGEGDPAWYLEKGEVSVPKAGRPEEGEEFKGRPFSH